MTEQPFFKPFSIGELVLDDLTGHRATVIGLSFHEGKTPQGNNIGSWGIWLDNDYLGGGRHPWEVEKIK